MLFAGHDDASEPQLPAGLTEPDIHEIAQCEMELLGFPVTLDPLTHLGRCGTGVSPVRFTGGTPVPQVTQQIDWSRYIPVDQLDRHLGKRVTVCGLVVADRINSTQNGELMKFVTLGDRTGFIEAFLFPDAYQRFGHLTAATPILAATGVAEPFENRNGFTFRVERVELPRKTEMIKSDSGTAAIHCRLCSSVGKSGNKLPHS
jgi:DNA polymerase III alpha subunit